MISSNHHEPCKISHCVGLYKLIPQTTVCNFCYWSCCIIPECDCEMILTVSVCKLTDNYVATVYWCFLDGRSRIITGRHFVGKGYPVVKVQVRRLGKKALKLGVLLATSYAHGVFTSNLLMFRLHSIQTRW